MNDRGVVNGDRISKLPEALILEILCLLPTKHAIATSVLSKQWQSYWKMLPNLKFDSVLQRLELEKVCKSLLSHKVPVLQSLHLNVRLDKCNNAVDTGFLIGIAFTRNVRELVLKVYFYQRAFTFPRRLYNCETLETLKLIHNVVIDVPSSVCLKSLRTLHLDFVDFNDDESVVKLLSGCPNLEDFMVRRYPYSRVKTFTIAVPSLQRLSIDNGNIGQGKWGYVINAPSLKYLEIIGLKAIESCVIENVPELVEAIIINVSEIIAVRRFVGITSVKRLSLALSPLKFKFPIGSIFHQLVCLELYTNKNAWWNLLTLMLDSSPKLQVLKLTGRLGLINNIVASGERYDQPKNVPECLLFHVEIFMWECYKWRREEEREVAKYILKNANRLKRATISLIGISPEERLEVEKDLKSVVRASSSCQFQFK